ncbi:MAG TPA: phage tail protein, partial [Longimicrobiaceae bacterium]|nr:phage tail protein [Longimicrobiaceae bacterium]
GLAFDNECRLYRSDREGGQVSRTLWKLSVPGVPLAERPEPVELFEAEPRGDLGDFAPMGPPPGPLHDPRGLAVDEDDRLFVAEYGQARIRVYDLWSHRLLRSVPTPPGTRPLDLATDGHQVWATLEGSPMLLWLTAREGPVLEPLPPEVLAPNRLAVSPRGEKAVLVGGGTANAAVVRVDGHYPPIAAPWAVDLEWESDDVLVAARWPGMDMPRWRVGPAGEEQRLPLVARGYDGGGIVRTPDGRIGYWSAKGFRTAAVARVRYAQRGTVITWRLDAGEYQAAWGRLFLDACIPAGSAVRVFTLTSDESFDEPAVPRTPPGNQVRATVRRPDLSPPMPPLSLYPAEPEWFPLHRRESGRELAWVQPESGDPFVTYEAPVMAGPGRYLWVGLELTGNSRVSPRLRSLRAEVPGHDLLRRLPKTFSREEPDAAFLRRFLALFDGLVSELENRAAFREVLLDPRATPEDMLPWLASFLGMALDERWPVARRRELVSWAAWLFRYRGTLTGLSKFLELYLGEPPVILEEYRVRGLGGAVLGGSGAAVSSAILGGGFRVGGAIGEEGQTMVDQSKLDDAFKLHAHRFSVLIRSMLTDEQLQVVNDILEMHRPAHTLVQLCTVGAGMRVGRGLHLAISTTVGRTGGFSTIQLGAAALGRGSIVGRPELAVFPEASRLGRDSRVG